MQYRYQVNPFECGVRAIQNSLLTLKADVDRDTIKSLAGTNRYSGTSKRGIVRAVRKLGFSATIYQTRNSEWAWRWLSKWSQKTPCILLLDGMEHWSAVTAHIAGKVILVDSSYEGEDKMGAHCLDKQETLDRWFGRGFYYAIRVSKV